MNPEMNCILPRYGFRSVTEQDAKTGDTVRGWRCDKPSGENN